MATNSFLGARILCISFDPLHDSFPSLSNRSHLTPTIKLHSFQVRSNVILQSYFLTAIGLYSVVWLQPGVAAATPPNRPQRCILTDYFNSYNFSKVQIIRSLMMVIKPNM
jgi:hypothetical protein